MYVFERCATCIDTVSSFHKKILLCEKYLRECGFLVTLIFPYKDKIDILAYFMQFYNDSF